MLRRALANPKLLALAGGSLGLLTGIGLGLAGYAFAAEPFNIELERLTVQLSGARRRLPARGLRILHISDTHFQGKDRREQIKIKRICALCADLEYDLLVHTGDFLHYDGGLANILTLLDRLPAPKLGRLAVFGNHDYTHYAMEEAIPRMWRRFTHDEQTDRSRVLNAIDMPFKMLRFGRYVRHTPLDGRRTGSNDASSLAAHLEARGFQILHNRSLRLQESDAAGNVTDIYIAGVDDLVEGTPQLDRALAGIPAEAPTLLLSHNPDIVFDPGASQVDLVLSGHTHGGQVVLPLWGPAHTQAQRLRRRNVAGYFRRGATHIYITRGVGEGMPVRFRARPQVALISVTADQNEG